MKRPLLLAALLAATPLALGSAAKADPLNMFNIQTPQAGVINFSGTGTANFNQSLGTNNSFNVGSSTNLGVNASASSTEDYDSSGSATLNLAGTSRLQQTIGTATNAFNAQTAAESSAQSASTAASVAANTAATNVANSSSYGSEWSSSWNAEHATDQGWEYKAEGELNVEAGYTSSDGTNDGNDTAAGYYEVGAAYGAEGSYQTTETWESSSQAAWESGWESEYNNAFTTSYSEVYETTYNTATAAAATQSTTANSTGTISGDFETTNKGHAGASLDSQTANFEAAAEYAAAYKYGGSYDSNNDSENGGYDYTSQADYNAKYAAEYSAGYSAAYSEANTKLESTSDSVVTVEGIGVIADVNASNTSSFVASSDLITGADRDGNGNGNASAGANLATSSYANQSNNTSANAFMQAFSGGGLEGATEVTGVSGNSSDGYAVTTSTTTVVDTTYDSSDGTTFVAR